MTELKDIYGVLGLVATEIGHTEISRHSPKRYYRETYPMLNDALADPQDFISERFWEAIFSREKV